MTEVVRGSATKTYAVPRTVTTICKKSFKRGVAQGLESIKLNEGLKELEYGCFGYSEIRRVVLPASVNSISTDAFTDCNKLRYVDLRAARGLKVLSKHAFWDCGRLDQILLNDGLEVICENCFYQCELKEITVPSSVKRIE